MNFDLPSIVKMALAEDMPHGDLTTDGLKLDEKMGRAKLVAKEDLVLSGSEIFTLVFHQLDGQTKINWQFQDGDFVFKGQTLCTIRGALAAMLKAERVALNFLGRLSGVASLTRCYVNQVKHTQTRILDTRKTTPGLRALEKKAVVHGGGMNHRAHLSEAILIKENHIHAVGGIQEAIQALRRRGLGPIEIEVRNVKEVREAIANQADRLLLDNMSDMDMAEALRLVPANLKTEASGNMTLDRVKHVAELGVDFISVGAITHSAPCADISLLFE